MAYKSVMIFTVFLFLFDKFFVLEISVRHVDHCVKIDSINRLAHLQAFVDFLGQERPNPVRVPCEKSAVRRQLR